MPKLLILSRHAPDYHRLIVAEGLPDIEITTATDPSGLMSAPAFEIVLGEPSLIRQVLPRLEALRWIHLGRSRAAARSVTAP